MIACPSSFAITPPRSDGRLAVRRRSSPGRSCVPKLRVLRARAGDFRQRRPVALHHCRDLPVRTSVCESQKGMIRNFGTIRHEDGRTLPHESRGRGGATRGERWHSGPVHPGVAIGSYTPGSTSTPGTKRRRRVAAAIGGYREWRMERA
eukprot:5151254-Prymnesium_polylepis.1